MHHRLLQPEDAAGIPPLTLPGLEAVKQLWAALKISLLVNVFAVTLLAVWEGLYQPCSKKIVLESCHSVRYLEFFFFFYRIRN